MNHGVNVNEFRYEREMRAPVADWLRANRYLVAYEFHLCHMVDLVAGHFGYRHGKAIPPLEHTIAVELKLDDVAGVIRQAKNNTYFVNRSYCAMPASRCLTMRASTLALFAQANVGLLSVSSDETIEVVVSPGEGKQANDRTTKGLWRRVRNEYKTAAAVKGA
jgi:hypothetical protein